MKLGVKEKQVLAMWAREAYVRQEKCGLVGDETFDAWRRRVVKETVGREGLSGCERKHFRALQAAFAVLSGREEVALRAMLKTGEVARKPRGASTGKKAGWKTAVPDTYEEREAQMAMIERELKIHGWNVEHGKHEGRAIGWGYVLSVAKAKFGLALMPKPEGLVRVCTAQQLMQLHYTLRNRIHAAAGVGASENRNKSQREKQREK